MKIRVQYTYEVDLSESEYEDFVGMVREVYEDEGLDVLEDVAGGVPAAVADFVVRESHVGNYNKYVTETFDVLDTEF